MITSLKYLIPACLVYLTCLSSLHAQEEKNYNLLLTTLDSHGVQTEKDLQEFIKNKKNLLENIMLVGWTYSFNNWNGKTLYEFLEELSKLYKNTNFIIKNLHYTNQVSKNLGHYLTNDELVSQAIQQLREATKQFKQEKIDEIHKIIDQTLLKPLNDQKLHTRERNEREENNTNNNSLFDDDNSNKDWKYKVKISFFKQKEDFQNNKYKVNGDIDQYTLTYNFNHEQKLDPHVLADKVVKKLSLEDVDDAIEVYFTERVQLKVNLLEINELGNSEDLKRILMKEKYGLRQGNKTIQVGLSIVLDQNKLIVKEPIQVNSNRKITSFIMRKHDNNTSELDEEFSSASNQEKNNKNNNTDNNSLFDNHNNNNNNSSEQLVYHDTDDVNSTLRPDDTDHDTDDNQDNEPTPQFNTNNNNNSSLFDDDNNNNNNELPDQVSSIDYFDNDDSGDDNNKNWTHQVNLSFFKKNKNSGIYKRLACINENQENVNGFQVKVVFGDMLVPYHLANKLVNQLSLNNVADEIEVCFRKQLKVNLLSENVNKNRNLKESLIGEYYYINHVQQFVKVNLAIVLDQNKLTVREPIQVDSYEGKILSRIIKNPNDYDNYERKENLSDREDEFDNEEELSTHQQPLNNYSKSKNNKSKKKQSQLDSQDNEPLLGETPHEKNNLKSTTLLLVCIPVVAYLLLPPKKIKKPIALSPIKGSGPIPVTGPISPAVPSCAPNIIGVTPMG